MTKLIAAFRSFANAPKNIVLKKKTVTHCHEGRTSCVILGQKLSLITNFCALIIIYS